MPQQLNCDCYLRLSLSRFQPFTYCPSASVCPQNSSLVYRLPNNSRWGRVAGKLVTFAADCLILIRTELSSVCYPLPPPEAQSKSSLRPRCAFRCSGI